ncbi:cholinephosphate cytidylyltransferase/choline kinase [Actinobacillus minor NM305]|uniref:Cholinephosphate cytidylyltransferase/choline kinase n=1 Tax=Actinobacillus minor NM305 TaxID=637911 RepID=C5S1B9_9PAST|nr:NTP transferase domain-containing protein [Actinobacillus minor]EER47350.1 cholinephosphate cytidylyltransferase/choline kinase [Actinobacillus minor NM305]
MKHSKRNAIILAAGFGMRMVPINTAQPKALLSVNGEVLIERLICQLHEAGIKDIKVVVGYMKEMFQYLESKYDIDLVESPQYSDSNNLYSLSLVAENISDTFILPCDIWCLKNPFIADYQHSFYIMYDEQIHCEKEYWKMMTGIAYIAQEDAEKLRNSMRAVAIDDVNNLAFWEEALYDENKLWLSPYFISKQMIHQINTFEDLRALDSKSEHLQSDAIDVICKVFQVNPSSIIGIKALKKGMTNRSFLFSCNGNQYIMRIPGEGTDMLINRHQETSVYSVLMNTGVCDDVLYINPKNGYKITRFLEEARSCNPYCEQDVQNCMMKLKCFHQLNLHVDHEFDIFGQIEFYQGLLKEKQSIYQDYQKIKNCIFNFSSFIEKYTEKKVLSHIDAIPDNFLLYSKDGKGEVCLIDWEYAGMQDPHVDIAMFAIYSGYDRKNIDHLIDIYFENKCSKEVRLKIYAYVAACGLLWSNWCEYKRILGIEFGEYAHRQYSYAREYSALVIQLLDEEK